MLTNGPGDPAENVGIIENIRKLAGKLPIFGICLGHQLFALAMGGKTRKMKYGHRGANQPVKDLETGTVYISSQNHGYEVLADSIKGVGCSALSTRTTIPARASTIPTQRLHGAVPPRSVRGPAGRARSVRPIHEP